MNKSAKPNKALPIILLLLLLVLNLFIVFGGFDNSGKSVISSQTDRTDNNSPSVVQASGKEKNRKTNGNISSTIGADGMSLKRAAPKPLELGISECSVYCRDSYQLVPLCGTGASWSSSDESIATVDGNGTVTAKSAGSAVITVADSAGNTDTCTVNVIKVLYVTIDDTPTEYTEKLLEILDRYNVQATFFMNADPDMAHKYRMIYERGHMLALHGYRHATSYADGSAFLDNMEKCRAFIMETTGCLSSDIDNVLRFPTGSKGQKRYREILEYIQNHDYTAFDWTTEFHDYYYHTAEGCLNYYKEFLRGDRAVMLFHTREWSIEALPDALDYAIEQGYTFAPITRDTTQYNFYGFYVR